MRNLRSKIISLALVVAMVFTLIPMGSICVKADSYDDYRATGLTWDGNVAKWTAPVAEGLIKYRLNLYNGSSYVKIVETTDTEYDFDEIFFGNGSGDYTFNVCAYYSDVIYYETNYSEANTYTQHVCTVEEVTEDTLNTYYQCTECGRTYKDAGKYNRIYDSELTTYKNTIHNATVTIDVPALGSHPATTAQSGNSSVYTVSNISWSDIDTSAGDTFTSGVAYTVTMRVIPTGSYILDADTLTINGKTPTINEGSFNTYTTYSITFDALECTHSDLTHVTANAATCTTAGNSEYYKCTTCGKYFEDSEAENEITDKSSVVVAALGHSLTKVEAADATCTTDGNNEYYKCSTCNNTYTSMAANIPAYDSYIKIPATGHSITKVEAKAATCSEEGNSEYYVCSKCDAYFSDEDGNTEITDKDSVIIAKTAHSLTCVEAADATCTQTGNTAYYKCTVCDKYFSDAEGTNEITDKSSVVTEALGHDYQPECDEEYYWEECSRCKAVKEGSKVAHVFSDWNYTSEVHWKNCDCGYSTEFEAHSLSGADGQDKVCTVCGYVAHDLICVEEKEATCTENGNIEYWKCSNCNKCFSDENGTTEITDVVIPATGHSLTHVEGKAATCTTDGNVEYWECSVCEKHFSDEGGNTEIEDTVDPATGHSLTHVEAVDATCTATGNIEYWVCSACEKYFSDSEGKTEITDKSSVITAKTAHTGGTATCKAKAVCEVCHQEYGDYAAHALTHTEAVDATCTEDGTVEYWECSVCEKYFSDEDCNTEITDLVDRATGHNIVHVAAKSASCTVAGNTEYYVCDACGKYFSDAAGTSEITNKTSVTIAALGHNYVATTTKATLTANGSTTYKCSRCSTVDSSRTVVISRPSTYTLAATLYVYTGSAIKPAVTVKALNGTTIASSNYTVTYSNNTAAGKATVTITFKNNYSGTKTLNFGIKPKATAISSILNKASSIKLAWSKNAQATGYKLYRRIGTGSWTLIKTITSNATVTYLDTAATSNGTRYQYKIYAYKTSNGTTYTSAASSVVTKYRLSRPVISSLTAASKAFTVKWGKNSSATGYQIRYSTDSSFTSYKSVTISANSTVSRKISSLVSSKKYYVRVRSFKTVSGTKYWSCWSAAKNVTTK